MCFFTNYEITSFNVKLKAQIRRSKILFTDNC